MASKRDRPEESQVPQRFHTVRDDKAGTCAGALANKIVFAIRRGHTRYDERKVSSRRKSDHSVEVQLCNDYVTLIDRGKLRTDQSGIGLRKDMQAEVGYVLA